MNILLIYPYFLNPRIHLDEIAAVPMGLYYIGALLKAHGHQVEILNWHNAHDAGGAIQEALIAKKPDMIGFSIVHANRWGAIDIARMAKNILPDVPVVFGGIGATFLWHHLLTHFQQIDYVVLGEGEYTFLNLVSAISNKAPAKAITAIRGLSMRGDQGPFKTEAAPLIRNLDELPPPAQYFDFEHISLTRGCPGRCTFCGSPSFWGRRVRAHSTDYMVAQLDMLSRRGATHFFLSDDTFTLNADRVIDLCQKIIHRGLPFSWQAISKVSAVRDDMLYWMRKAGCTQISYGVESGSPKIREQLCKDIREDQIQKAFDRTVAHGIMARAYFIYGSPEETWETIEQSLALIRRIKPLSAIFYIMDIFPGTAMYDAYKARSGVDDDIWLERIEDKLYFETDDALDWETIKAFGRRLRDTYQQWLPEFAMNIELENHDELLAEQADFLSRLAMTFSHGDYAGIKSTIPAVHVAGSLFQRALDRHADHRAFWGLALVQQQLGDLDGAIATLQQGLVHFPRSPQLNICLGIGYRHKGQYRCALDHLTPFDHDPGAVPHIIGCLNAQGRHQEAEKYQQFR
jgi:radical SAM superfamily enzyme YgiQ (UPF0313 family)